MRLRNFKPPSAHKSTQYHDQRNLSSLELNLSSISKFQRTTDQQGLYNDAEAEMDMKDDSSKNPMILSNTPLRFVMENELEGPAAKWFSTESCSREEPSLKVCLRVNIPGNLGVRLPRV